MNKTKMIGTLGPSSSTYEVIRDMISSGVDVIRINMNYASFDFAKEAILNVRKINLEYGLETGIMLDTRGPDIRIGGLIKPSIKLEKNKMIRLVSSDIIGDSEIISVPYKELITHSKIGDEIYLNNAEIKLIVLNKDEDTLMCSIKNDGIIKPDSTINIPNINLNLKFLSNYDKEVIRFAVLMQVDYLALSHVKDEMDVLDVNDALIGLNDNNAEDISKAIRVNKSLISLNLIFNTITIDGMRKIGLYIGKNNNIFEVKMLLNNISKEDRNIIISECPHIIFN